jgi:hypothetical protein
MQLSLFSMQEAETGFLDVENVLLGKRKRSKKI